MSWLVGYPQACIHRHTPWLISAKAQILGDEALGRNIDGVVHGLTCSSLTDSVMVLLVSLVQRNHPANVTTVTGTRSQLDISTGCKQDSNVLAVEPDKGAVMMCHCREA